ncbi:MAG: N-acetylmuramoyl-L-alanine amidase [Bacteroidales bacterium]
MNRKLLLYINLLVVLSFFVPALHAGEKIFTVVIDAGHGGKDPGARGRVIDEKIINLSVALKLGDLITEKHSDVKVIYTRKTDRFIELDERANIANRNKADLFISIHTNAVKRGNNVVGTETYTLGLARTDENLGVAMRENSAILLEDNYLQKYEGFDPNSSESYIIFEFMQNKHVEQSIGLASEIQKAFTVANRENRGVRQAGLLVLRKTSMPSVLVELGFISNREEERFMKTEAGRNMLSRALYNAFSKYKREYDRKQGALSDDSAIAPLEQLETTAEVREVQAAPQTQPAEEYTAFPVGSEEDILQRKQRESDVESVSVDTSDRESSTIPRLANTDKVKDINKKDVLIYKIQILTAEKKLSSSSKLFKGYKGVDFFVERGIYKYTYGETTDFNTIRNLRRKVAKNFKDAFIVAFKDGQKVEY